MKIGLLIDSLIPNGAQIVVQELAEGLSNRGHQVTLFYYHHCNGQIPSIASRFKNNDIKIKWIYGPNRTPRRYIARMDAFRTSRLIKKMGIDILNIHTWEASYSIHVSAHLPRDFPIVFTHHGTKICNLGKSSRNWIHLGVNSRYRYEYEGRDYNDHCNTIDIGIDKEALDRFKVTKENARTILGLDVDKPVLLTIGRSSKHKGCDIWMEVVRKLSAEYPGSFKYVFIGADNRGPLYSDHVAFGQSNNDVILQPTLKHEDVIMWMCASDMLLVPSRTESFALKAVESLYCGRPVVTHYLGILQDLIKDGINGAIVDYMDIDALKNAAAQWLHNRRTIKTDIPDKYFAETMVARYERCFEDLLNQTHKTESFMKKW